MTTPDQERLARRAQKLTPALLAACIRNDPTRDEDSQAILEEMLGRSMSELDEGLTEDEVREFVRGWPMIVGAVTSASASLIVTLCEQRDLDPLAVLEQMAAALAAGMPDD